MTTKTVEWSYPTSSNAKKMGFHDSGCWTVETSTDNQPPKAIIGFKSRESALKAARVLEWNWSPLFLKFHPEDCV